jgi:hypothetical protein
MGANYKISLASESKWKTQSINKYLNINLFSN